MADRRSSSGALRPDDKDKAPLVAAPKDAAPVEVGEGDANQNRRGSSRADKKKDPLVVAERKDVVAPLEDGEGDANQNRKRSSSRLRPEDKMKGLLITDVAAPEEDREGDAETTDQSSSGGMTPEPLVTVPNATALISLGGDAELAQILLATPVKNLLIFADRASDEVRIRIIQHIMEMWRLTGKDVAKTRDVARRVPQKQAVTDQYWGSRKPRSVTRRVPKKPGTSNTPRLRRAPKPVDRHSAQTHRPLVCKKCEKTFARQSNLTTHSAKCTGGEGPDAELRREARQGDEPSKLVGAARRKRKSRD